MCHRCYCHRSSDHHSVTLTLLPLHVGISTHSTQRFLAHARGHHDEHKTRHRLSTMRQNQHETSRQNHHEFYASAAHCLHAVPPPLLVMFVTLAMPPFHFSSAGDTRTAFHRDWRAPITGVVAWNMVALCLSSCQCVLATFNAVRCHRVTSQSSSDVSC